MYRILISKVYETYMINTNIIDYLKKELGINQRKIAEELGVSHITVSKWRTKERSIKHEYRKKLLKLANLYWPLDNTALFSKELETFDTDWNVMIQNAFNQDSWYKYFEEGVGQELNRLFQEELDYLNFPYPDEERPTSNYDEYIPEYLLLEKVRGILKILNSLNIPFPLDANPLSMPPQSVEDFHPQRELFDQITSELANRILIRHKVIDSMRDKRHGQPNASPQQLDILNSIDTQTILSVLPKFKYAHKFKEHDFHKYSSDLLVKVGNILDDEYGPNREDQKSRANTVGWPRYINDLENELASTDEENLVTFQREFENGVFDSLESDKKTDLSVELDTSHWSHAEKELYRFTKERLDKQDQKLDQIIELLKGGV